MCRRLNSPGPFKFVLIHWTFLRTSITCRQGHSGLFEIELSIDRLIAQFERKVDQNELKHFSAVGIQKCQIIEREHQFFERSLQTITLTTGPGAIQQTYLKAEEKLRSHRKVFETISFPDPETHDVWYLSRHAPLITCLNRTALPLCWEPTMNGGTDPYLCPEDMIAFEGLVVQHTGDVKCILTHKISAIGHDVPQACHDKAITLLKSIGSDGLAEDSNCAIIGGPKSSRPPISH
jgi:hypothetical protein